MSGSRRGRRSGTEKKQTDRSQTREPQTLAEAWRARPGKLILTGLLSVAVAAYVGWTVASQYGLARAALWGLIAAATIWAAFSASFYFAKWIRQR
jgi:hypothetical protein